MVHHSGAGPEPSRDTGHGVVVENGERSSGESRFGAGGAMRSPGRPPGRPPGRRSPRDLRNIAVALALLAFAVIMFLVTIVKFDEQIQRIGMSQTRGAGTNPSRFGDSNGGVADFDRGGDRVDRGDVGRGIAVAAGVCSGRPEESGGAVSRGRHQRSWV